MSKPSEKAKRFAEKWEDNTYARDRLARLLDNFATPELEAQHRKTWALAMEAAQQAVRKTDLKFLYRINDAIRALPCPPIEATKDK